MTTPKQSIQPGVPRCTGHPGAEDWCRWPGCSWPLLRSPCWGRPRLSGAALSGAPVHRIIEAEPPTVQRGHQAQLLYSKKTEDMDVLCFAVFAATEWISSLVETKLHFISLPGGSLTNLFLQANALIYLSFSCMFIHSMFMNYEILTVPMPHVLRCPMYVCL